ncbi:MAG TPA: RluA family pseudouridine synthase [Planctomycetota bacterium]|nr:RluA family pseudouridine synthase [Planctomycetota bacterium]
MRLFKKDRDLNASVEEVVLTVDASALRMTAAEVHVRLDVFLALHLSWRSRSSVQNLIREGSVQVDPASPEHPQGSGKPVVERRPGRKLLHGSQVIVAVPDDQPVRRIEPPSTTEISVLYEDDDALVVDKPALLAVHPSGRYLSDTLIQRVHAHFHYDRMHRDARPRLCHRLDRETSGVILIGKTPQSHAEFMRQFEARETEKEYLAIVHGVVEAEDGIIDLPIGPSRTSAVELKMAVQADGQEAVTHWNVVERKRRCTLVAARPFTGRQHQIRVHFDAIGHPLVGDKLYGVDEALFQRYAEDALTERDLEELELERHALHNHRLVFTSPTTKARIEVASPLPRDLETYLALDG